MSYFPKGGVELPILYIHIPKTGGSSVSEWYTQQYGTYRMCIHGSMKVDLLYNASKSMPSFTIVRNPYDLVYSWYRWMKTKLTEMKEVCDRTGMPFPRECQDEAYSWSRGFEYWLERNIDVKSIIDDGELSFNNISPSYNQLSYCKRDDIVCVDHFLKLENIEQDWKIVQEITKSPYNLGLHNRTVFRGQDYKDAHTVVTKRIVEKYYEEDLETFGYKFN